MDKALKAKLEELTNAHGDVKKYNKDLSQALKELNNLSMIVEEMYIEMADLRNEINELEGDASSPESQNKIEKLNNILSELVSGAEKIEQNKNAANSAVDACYLNLDSAGKKCQDLCFALQNMMQAVAS